jgi:cytochrome c oxidase subunit 4
MTPRAVRVYAWTWAALLALLALTTASAFLPLGTLNLVLNLLIALAKALLVALVFMQLARDTPVVRAAALAGWFTLLLLASLALLDFAARSL